MYSGGEETEGDKGDKGVGEVSSEVLSYNNLSSTKTLFGSTPSFARVFRELRFFGKPIASKSLPKDKWMPLLGWGNGELSEGDEGDEGDN
jgi:hypothetical protein